MIDREDLLSRLRDSVIEGEAEQVQELCRTALAEGLEPMRIIDEALVPAIGEVGSGFERGIFFLPDLVLCGEAMQAGTDIVQKALLEAGGHIQSRGTVVMGTVEGDIHEIGKNIVITMLRVNGFTVHDLGVDVPVSRFLAAVRDLRADIVGLSALLTTTVKRQKEIIDSLREAGLAGQVKVLVGGAPITPEWAQSIGADGYGHNAIAAVEEARRLMELRS
jgi:corrinoid protein of di/trimethylamine methyltransferase